jgi:hypothetical protein
VLATEALRLDEIFKKTALALRERGFRGSGSTFRKVEGDFVFVINFQRSRWGDAFFVNLGAQPTFIPAEGNAPLKTLKEHECIWRRRVGSEWPAELSNERFASFVEELTATQRAFFDHATTFRSAVTTETPETLLDRFGAGATRARAALHLARAALALKHPEVACGLATRGLDLAGDGATILLAELRELLARVQG